MWKYVLFDLDGTITDSREGITNCIRYALDAAGVPIPEEDVLLRFIGPPLIDGFQEIIGMNYEDAQKATAKYRERYHVTGLYEAAMYEGIDQVFALLKKQGKRISLATSKPEEFAGKILEHFGVASYFDEITGSTLQGERNTKTAVIQEALRRLGVPEEEKSKVLMIGDRKHDILGAKECGIPSLGVYYGFAEPGELEKAGADYTVQTVEEVKHFFNKFM